jgi:retron-type reverse transcriptase
VLRTVSQSLSTHNYCPYPAGKVLIPKGNGRFRELRLAIIVDRTIAKALQEAVTPLLGTLFLPGVYGFRPGRNTWDMLLAIEKTALEQDRWVLAVDDVKDAFPSVRIADVLADYHPHIRDARKPPRSP